MSSKTDIERRKALAKLAALSAYSTPAVMTLLSPTLSYAQTSGTVNEYNEGNLNNNEIRAYERCIDPNHPKQNMAAGLGNNLTGGNSGDDLSDCNKQ